MRNIINRHFKVTRADGTTKEFVLLQDGANYESVCYDFLDRHGYTTKPLTGHELSISDTLEECKRKTKRLVLVQEIMENHEGITEWEAEQILDFGEVRVTSQELVDTINRGDKVAFEKLKQEVM